MIYQSDYRQLLRLPEFKTKKARMGKVVLVRETRLQYYSQPEKLVHILRWPTLQDNICCGSARRSGLLRCPGHAAMLLARALEGVLPRWGPQEPFLLPIRARARAMGSPFPNSTAPQCPGLSGAPRPPLRWPWGQRHKACLCRYSSPLPACASAASAWRSQNVMSMARLEFGWR